MSVTPLDSALYRGLLGDPEIAALLSDEAEIAAMIRAERALAIVQVRLGMIPLAEGAALASAVERLRIAPAALADGVARDGVIAPALVAALRAELPGEAGAFLHWGMTSQDVQDLGLVLRLRDILELIDRRLRGLIGRLAALAGAHLETPCLARTRMQAAAPTLFGLKAAQWLAPLLRHRERIAQLRPRLLAVQLGGAAGNLAAFGADALPLMDALADELGLSRAEPWHKSRDRFEEFGALLAMIASSLGTIGADLALLAQNEVGEIRFAGAGGSSTLPQKQNPVLAEILISLARHVGTLAGGLHQAGIHANERDGSAWTLEGLTLPPLIAATGAALLRCDEMLSSLNVDAEKMRENIEATRGLVLAEAASFALAAQMTRAEATALVKRAVDATFGSQRPFLDHLAELSAVALDWDALKRAEAALAPARALAERLIELARTNLKAG